MNILISVIVGHLYGILLYLAFNESPALMLFTIVGGLISVGIYIAVKHERGEL